MKQIYLHILAVAVASLILPGCDKGDIEPDAGNVAPVFTAAIEGVQSRVSGDYWEPGDQIGISYTSASLYNACYETIAGDGEFSVKNVGEKLYFKSTTSTTQVTFYAYYPYKEIENPSVTANRSIEVNTTNQTEQKTFDYLFATAKGTKDSPFVNFEFAHKMSKVTFVFKDGDSFSVNDIVSCKLGELYTTAKFSTTGGTFTMASKSVVDVKLSDFKESEPGLPLILIPQTVSTLRLEITASDNNIYAVDLTVPSGRLAGGTNYKYTIKVSRTGLTVVNCTIEDWTSKEDTGWGTGTADSADSPDE